MVHAVAVCYRKEQGQLLCKESMWLNGILGHYMGVNIFVQDHSWSDGTATPKSDRHRPPPYNCIQLLGSRFMISLDNQS